MARKVSTRARRDHARDLLAERLAPILVSACVSLSVCGLGPAPGLAAPPNHSFELGEGDPSGAPFLSAPAAESACGPAFQTSVAAHFAGTDVFTADIRNPDPCSLAANADPWYDGSEA